MKKNAFANLISVLVLITMLVTQILPASLLQAAPAPVSAASSTGPGANPQPMRVNERPLKLNDVDICFNQTGSFLACILDGRDGTPTMTVIRAGTGQQIKEPANVGPGNPSPLLAYPGDTIRIPFAVAYVAQGSCPATVDVPGFRIAIGAGVDPSTTVNITGTFLGGSPNSLTFQDGALGPFDGTSQDTLFGYFDWVVDPVYAKVDGNGSNLSYLNFQITANANSCGQRPKVDMLGGQFYSQSFWFQPWRRVQIAGFSASRLGPVDVTVPEQNSTSLGFRLSNITTQTAFTYAASFQPAGTSVPVSFFVSGTSTPCPAQIDPNTVQDCVAVIGPMPRTVSAVITTLTITGTPTGGGTTVTQNVQYNVTVLHPAITVTKQTVPPDKVFAQGEAATYQITITNTGGLPLNNFVITDSLKGDIKSTFTAPCNANTTDLTAGGTCTGTYTYTVLASDTNPLLNTVNVQATWTPSNGQTGNPVTISAQATNQAAIENANLDVRFAGASTPDYALINGTITGALQIKNTGTVPINNVTGVAQLVNTANPTQILQTVQLGLPTTIDKQVTLNPNPTYTVPVPALPNGIYSVDLVILVNGISATGVSVPRKITRSFDVVRSNLRVQVTSDALSNLVSRGQVVTYTVKLQNITQSPLTNIRITQESLGAVPGGFSPIASLAGGASVTLPSFSYLVGVNTASPVNELIEATFNADDQKSTGLLSLTISDIQVKVQLLPKCQFSGADPTAANMAKDCTVAGSAPVVGSTLSLETTVRFFALLTNTGPTAVTNVRACLGNVVTCDPPQPGQEANSPYIPLSTNSLDNLQGSATGEKSRYYSTTPGDPRIDPTIQGTSYTQVITVLVKDQSQKDVAIRQTVTFAIVSANQYWTVTKSTADGKSAYFVGDTIPYQVKACYDGALASDAIPLTGVQGTDPFAGPNPITLQVTRNGTAIGSPATSVTLNKGDCAEGSYNYTPTAALLGSAPQVDLTNTITFTTTGNIPAKQAQQSLVVKLNNPIQLTKIATQDGTNQISSVLYSGEAFTYKYTIANVSTNTISNVVVTDKINDQDLYKGTCDTAWPTALNPGQTVIVNCPAFAYGATGQSGVAQVSFVNQLVVAGKVNAIDVSATTNATIKVQPPLSVTKTVDNAIPFFYDPPITYTVTVKNITPANKAITVQLEKAEDSLNGVIQTPVTAATLAQKFDASNNPIGSPVAISSIALAPGESATYSYKLSPRDAPQNGPFGGTVNRATVYGRILSQGASVLPVKDEFRFSVFKELTIAVVAPLTIFECPVNAVSYFGWLEEAVWDIEVINFPDSGKNVTLGTVTTTLTGSEQAVTLTFPGGTRTLAPGQKATGQVKYRPTWKDPRVTFDGSKSFADFTVEGVSGNFKLISELSCQGVTIGPPVKMTKTATPASGKPGDTITYSVAIENPTTYTTVSNLVLKDLTLGLPNQNNLPLKLQPGGTVTTQVGPGQTLKTDDLPYVIKASDPSPLVNTVELSGQITNNVISTPTAFPENLQAKATVALPSPIVEVTLLTAGIDGIFKTGFNPNERIVYVAKVTNKGLTPVSLDSASTTSAAVTGFTPTDGLTKWAAVHQYQGQNTGKILAPGETAFIEETTVFNPTETHSGLYRADAPPDPNVTNPPSYTVTSSVTFNFTLQNQTQTPGTASATVTADLLNPNLRVTLNNKTKGVVPYGAVVEYTLRVENPATSGVQISGLQVTEERPAPNDYFTKWSLNGDPNQANWTDNPPPTLNPGEYIERTVKHQVTPSDFSPVTYRATAVGQFVVNGVTFTARDVRTSLIIISDRQLDTYISKDKDTMRPGDANKITIGYTNIGTLAVTELTVTVSAEDSAGNALSLPFSFNATCVLNVPADTDPSLDATTKAKCQQLPPIGDPNIPLQLDILDRTLSEFSFKVPLDQAAFNTLPNPLVIKFQANGKTNDGLTFDTVTTRVPIKIQQSAVLINETPNVSAVPVNGQVKYNVSVSNLSSTDDILVSEVKDSKGQPVLLSFGGGTPTATGTIPKNGTVSGTSDPVTVTINDGNPYLHTTTVKGTQGGLAVSDTSSSQVQVLSNFIDVSYTSTDPVVTPASPVTFKIVIQNTGNGPVTLTAKDVTDTLNPRALTLYRDSTYTTVLGPTDTVAVGAFAYGKNDVTAPNTRGTFSSTLEVTATNDSNQQVTVQRIASVQVVGVGLLYTGAPTPLVAFGKPGDDIFIDFTVKNTGNQDTDVIQNLSVTCAGLPANTCTDVTTGGFNGKNLAKQAELAGRIQYTIQPSDSGLITLQVQVSGTQQGTNDVVTVVAPASFTVTTGGLLLTKTASVTSSAPGQPITYTVKLENTSSTDTITLGTVFDTLKGALTPSVTTLPPSGSTTISYGYNIPVTASGALQNTVSATFTVNNQPYTAQATATVNIIPTGAGLIVRVTPSKLNASANDSVTFLTEVTNLSSTDAVTGLVATSSLPNVNMGVSGTIAPGQTKAFTSTAYVIPGTASGQITNIVTVNGSSAVTGGPVSGVGTAVINIRTPEGLIVTKVANKPTAQAGDNVTYTVSIRNDGPDALIIRNIDDNLSPITGLTYPIPVPAFTTLPPIAYIRTVKATDQPGLLQNTVTVTAARFESTPPSDYFFASATASVTITTGTTGLLITAQTSQSSYAVGDNIVYNAVVTNTGSTPITNVAAQWAVAGTSSTGAIPLNIATLPVGGQAFGTFTVQTVAGTPDPLIVSLNATGTINGSTTISGTGATSALPRTQQPVTVLFTAQPGTVTAAGDTVTYTLTVFNTSGATISGLTVDLDRTNGSPTNLTDAGISGGPNPFSTTFNGITLASNASRSASFTYTVQAGDVGKTALNVRAALTWTQNPSGITRDATSVVFGQPFKATLKATSAPCPATGSCFVKPGDKVTYTVTLQNSGTSALTGLSASINTFPATVIALSPSTLAAGATQDFTIQFMIPDSNLGFGNSTNTAQFVLIPTITITATKAADQGNAAQAVKAGNVFAADTVTAVLSGRQLNFFYPKLSLSNPTVVETQPIPDLTTFTMTFTVTNASPTPTTLNTDNTRVKVYLNSQDVTARIAAQSAGGITLSGTQLLPGGVSGSTQTVTVKFTIQGADVTPLKFTFVVTGCVAGGTCDSTNSINTPVMSPLSSELTVQVARASLIVTESPTNPKTATVGQPLVLSLLLSNTGGADVVGLQSGTVTLTNGTAIAEKVNFGSITTVPKGGANVTVTLSHVVTATDPTTLQFIIPFTGYSGAVNGPVVNATYTTQPVTVGAGNIAANGLAITKTASTTTTNNGGSVTWTITLQNTSQVAITNLAVIDTPPTTLAIKSASGSAGAVTSGNGTVTAAIGSLAPAASATITIETTVQNATAPASITNQACVTSATNTTPACSSSTVTIAAGASVLPTTGFGGSSSDPALGYLMLVLSALFFVALAARSGRGEKTLLIVLSIAAAIIAVGLLLTIVSSAMRRVDTIAKATATAGATQVAFVTGQPAPALPTRTPFPTLVVRPTLTPAPSRTYEPTATGLPSPVPPTAKPKLFEPVGDRSIFIPKLKLISAVPIVDLPLRNRTWDVSTLGHNVGHLEQTAWVGKTGNTVLAAHVQLNFQDMGPFKDLNLLQPGDPVMVYDRGDFYMYQVDAVTTVAPTAVEVTYPTTEPRLTLLTCTIWDPVRGAFAKRLVVTAKLVMGPEGFASATS